MLEAVVMLSNTRVDVWYTSLFHKLVRCSPPMGALSRNHISHHLVLICTCDNPV